MTSPPFRSNLGKRGSIQTIDGGERTYTIVDEISREQQVPEKGTLKMLCLQKLRFDDDSSIQYRFGYYMLGLRPGRSQGRWVWGQYAPLIPTEHIGLILREALKRGWEGI
jgi:hypothetical protein